MLKFLAALMDDCSLEAQNEKATPDGGPVWLASKR
jgi:hypothetical protein